MIIEPTRHEDSDRLSDLALRSKAHWGYDKDFLDACRDELTVTTDRMQTETMLVARGPGGEIAGFVSIAVEGTDAELMDLFVEPDHIGRGIGVALWRAACSRAAAAGAQWMTIEADPHAEPWYVARGAVRIGEAPSGSIAGRMLPLLAVELTPPDARPAEG